MAANPVQERLKTIYDREVATFAPRKLIDRRWPTHPDCKNPPYNTCHQIVARHA
jgi:hypothetical protein